jgi:hypothetical protein
MMEAELDETERASWALRSLIKFGATMVLLMFAAKIAAIPLILAVGGGDTTGPVVRAGFGLVLLAFAILPVETFLGSAFPIWGLRLCGIRNWPPLCILSAMFFGLFHLAAGPGGFMIGFATGVVLSYCWLSWREESLAAAFWYTTAVHAVHNAVAFFFFLLANQPRTPEHLSCDSRQHSAWQSS